MARYMDFVIGLITGKFETIEKRTGGTYKQFIPNRQNKHPTLVDLYRSQKRMTKEDIKVREGLLQPLHLLNRDVFKKTNTERVLLKEMKQDISKSIRDLGHNPDKRMNTSAPIIIRL